MRRCLGNMICPEKTNKESGLCPVNSCDLLTSYSLLTYLGLLLQGA